MLHEHKLIVRLIMKERTKLQSMKKMPELENWIVSQRQDVIRDFYNIVSFYGSQTWLIM